MARLVGYFANQSDRLRCALVREGPAVRGPHDHVDGWGVGSYQYGEVLLRRKPTEHRPTLDVLDLVSDLRTDTAVVHLRQASVGACTLENTHPFRYRQWLFAHNGSVSAFGELRARLSQAVPDFLLRGVRGETDSELLFALFLGIVHETGRIDDPEVDRRYLVDAVAKTVATVDAATDALGLPRSSLNCVLTNGTSLVAVRRGLPMAWIRRQGLRDCDVCRRLPDLPGRDPKRIDHDGYRYLFVSSDHGSTPESWSDVPDNPRGSALAATRSLDVLVTEF